MHLDRGPQLKTQIPARGRGSLCKPDCPTLCPDISNLFGLQFGPRVLSPQLRPSLGYTELPFPTLWPGNSRTITGLTTLQRSTSFLWIQDPENCCFLYLVFLPSSVVSDGRATWIPHISSCLKPSLLSSLFLNQEFCVTSSWGISCCGFLGKKYLPQKHLGWSLKMQVSELSPRPAPSKSLD